MDSKEEIELKPKTNKSFIDKIKGIFDDKKKRGLYVFLFILPFIIAMCIFGIVAYKEAKNVLNLITGSTDEISDENVIKSCNYVLRDNATDYQKELFSELKKAIEVDAADDQTIAGLVAKNYVADFYTWTNKQGQYDVGGMYYVCNEKKEDVKYKENIYMKARDGFYKYLNKYISDYGSQNLIEVDNVDVVSCSKASEKYKLHVYVETLGNEDIGWTPVYEDKEYDCYKVSLKWSYKPDTKLNLSDFGTSINLLIIKVDGRFEIVEASEKEINVRRVEEKTTTESTD